MTGEQPSLWDQPTSRAARESIQRDVPRCQALITRSLGVAGSRGCTAQELEDRTGLSGSTVRPRLLELQEEGAVICTTRTRATRRGRQARLYFLLTWAERTVPRAEWVTPGGKP